MSRHLNVASTQAEYDVLDHVDVALTAINAHLALFFAPFSA